jgi:hypothetical protein
MKNITFTPQAYKDYLNGLNEDKKNILEDYYTY